jgi:hypothetical protein
LTRPRLLTTLAIIGAVLAAGSAAVPSPAVASGRLNAIFEDDYRVMADPAGTIQTLRTLGVEVLRFSVRWDAVAPRASSRKRPPRFRATDPAAYPARNWSAIDRVVKDARNDGIVVDMNIEGGAPLWATGLGAPRDGQVHPNWEPSASEFGAFVAAVGVRYSGNYDPVLKRTVPGDPNDLPRVSFWSIWDEPNLGYTIAPQGVPGHLRIENSGHMYRNMLDQAWSALHRTGHGRDTILIGEIAPRGSSYWGVFAAMKPLVFLRALYCLDSRYHQLRGAAASIRGCPATAAGSRRFRAAHPALFQAPAFSDHLWMRWYPPNKEPQPDGNYSSFAELGGLERALDRVQRAYGSRRKLPIYDTEFGYITAPPNSAPFVSPRTAGEYLNWAEYLSWRDPRMASFDQYLLSDPAPTGSKYVGWSSGLLGFGGAPKPTYDAWRLPLYLPVTATSSGRSLEVWGCVRPSHFAILDTGQAQTAQIQFEPSGSGQWQTLRTVTISDSRNPYFDTSVSFPMSGAVRLAWTYPTTDSRLGYVDPLGSTTVYSRTVSITVR